MKMLFSFVLLVIFSVIETNGQTSIDYQIAIQETNEMVWSSQSLSPANNNQYLKSEIFIDSNFSGSSLLAVHQDPSLGKSVGVGALVGLALGVFLGKTIASGSSRHGAGLGVIMGGVGAMAGAVGGVVFYGAVRIDGGNEE